MSEIELSAICATNVQAMFDGYLGEKYSKVSECQSFIEGTNYRGVNCAKSEDMMFLETLKFEDSAAAGNTCDGTFEGDCTGVAVTSAKPATLKAKGCICLPLAYIKENTDGKSTEEIKAFLLNEIGKGMGDAVPDMMTKRAMKILSSVIPENELHTVQGEDFGARNRTRLFRLFGSDSDRLKSVVVDEELVTESLSEFVCDCDVSCKMGALSFYDTVVSNKCLVESTNEAIQDKAIALTTSAVKISLVGDIETHVETRATDTGVVADIKYWVTYEIGIKNFNFKVQDSIVASDVAESKDNWEPIYDIDNVEQVRRFAPAVQFKKEV